LAAKDAAGDAPPDAAGNAPPDAAGNTPPQDTTKNTPPQDAAKNTPPQDAAGNVPPSQDATGNASPSINLAGDASSSKKRKLSGDAEPEGEFEAGTLPDLDQLAGENNPIVGDEDDKNNSTPTVSFRTYGRRYGRR
jgi:hypothetical protein